MLNRTTAATFVISVAGIALVFPMTALTHREWPDGPEKEWFQNLQRPDNDAHPSRKIDPKSLYCCGAADVVKTKFKVESAGRQYPEDTWYAWLDEFMDQNSDRKDRQGSRPERAALPFRAGRHDPMLRAPQGRALTTRPKALPVGLGQPHYLQ